MRIEKKFEKYILFIFQLEAIKLILVHMYKLKNRNNNNNKNNNKKLKKKECIY